MMFFNHLRSTLLLATLSISTIASAVDGKNMSRSKAAELGVVSTFRSAETNSYACTGTLIARRVVLTAAHCVSSSAFIAFNSSPDDDSLFVFDKINFIKVASGIAHPDYQSNYDKSFSEYQTRFEALNKKKPDYQMENAYSAMAKVDLNDDVGLLILEEDAPEFYKTAVLQTTPITQKTTGLSLKEIVVPDSTKDFERSLFNILSISQVEVLKVGSGLKQSADFGAKGQTHKILRYDHSVWPMGVYKSLANSFGEDGDAYYYTVLGYNAFVESVLNNKNEIIIGADSSVCSGDSGGPLFLKIGGRWSQVGINSSGFTILDNSCGSYQPTTHASVPGHFQWIQKTLSQYKISIRQL